MSLLLLVRHGQATLDGDDYDQLSALGEEQARALAERWVERGETPDHALVGPRRRHRQTHDAVAAVYRDRGLPWPEPIDCPALDEHQGPEILSHHAPRIEAEVAAADGDAPYGNPIRDYMRLFRHGSRGWVRGELPTPDGHEDWPSFRGRVATGLESICDDPRFGARGSRIAAFTSGGAIAAAVGHTLDLDDEAVLELSWVVRNATVTTLRFSPGRGFGLLDFNGLAFDDPRLITFV